MDYFWYEEHGLIVGVDVEEIKKDEADTTTSASSLDKNSKN